ncbi:MAG: OmpA family protein [Bdellovibrionota bacterium]
MHLQKVIYDIFNFIRRSHLPRMRKIFAISMSIILTNDAFSNVIGGDTQNFNPNSDGIGFITVQSSQTLPQWSLNLGAFLDHAINTLPVFETVDGEQSRGTVNDSLTSLQLHIGYGLLKNWELGISLPYVLTQSVNSNQDYQGEFADNGLTAVSIDSKYHLWNNDRFGLAVIGSINANEIQDNPFAGKEAGPTINLELAGDVKLNKHLFAINIGHRFKKPGKKNAIDDPIDPIKNQFIWSGAANFAIDNTNYIVSEFYGSVPTNNTLNKSDRTNSSAEILASYKKIIPTMQLATYAGIASELMHGLSSPDWRLFAGINWTIETKKAPVEPVVIEKPEKFIEGPLGPIKKKEVITLHDILFAFNSDKLILRGQNTSVFKLKDQLDAGDGFKRLIIAGHTDSIGSSNYNRDLSKRRANTLRNWLIKNYDIDPKKVTTIGLGESEPIDTNNTEKGRQMNRRVEFKIFR